MKRATAAPPGGQTPKLQWIQRRYWHQMIFYYSSKGQAFTSVMKYRAAVILSLYHSVWLWNSFIWSSVIVVSCFSLFSLRACTCSFAPCSAFPGIPSEGSVCLPNSIQHSQPSKRSTWCTSRVETVVSSAALDRLHEFDAILLSANGSERLPRGALLPPLWLRVEVCRGP